MRLGLGLGLRVTCAVMKSAKFQMCSPMKKRAARSRSKVPWYCARGRGRGAVVLR